MENDSIVERGEECVRGAGCLWVSGRMLGHNLQGRSRWFLRSWKAGSRGSSLETKHNRTFSLHLFSPYNPPDLSSDIHPPPKRHPLITVHRRRSPHHRRIPVTLCVGLCNGDFWKLMASPLSGEGFGKRRELRPLDNLLRDRRSSLCPRLSGSRRPYPWT